MMKETEHQAPPVGRLDALLALGELDAVKSMDGMPPRIKKRMGAALLEVQQYFNEYGVHNLSELVSVLQTRDGQAAHEEGLLRRIDRLTQLLVYHEAPVRWENVTFQKIFEPHVTVHWLTRLSDDTLVGLFGSSYYLGMQRMTTFEPVGEDRMGVLGGKYRERAGAYDVIGVTPDDRIIARQPIITFDNMEFGESLALMDPKRGTSVPLIVGLRLLNAKEARYDANGNRLLIREGYDRIAAYDLTRKKKLFSTRKVVIYDQHSHLLGLSPDNTIVFFDRRFLYRYDPHASAVIDSIEIGYERHAFLDDGRVLYMVTDADAHNNALMLWDTAGKHRELTVFRDVVHNLVVQLFDEDTLVVVASHALRKCTVRAISLATGKTLWEQSIPSDANNSVSIVRRKFSGDFFLALDFNIYQFGEGEV